MAPGRSLPESSWKEAFRLIEGFPARTNWKEVFRVNDSGLDLPALDSRKEDFSTRDSVLVLLLEGRKEISANEGSPSVTLLDGRMEAFDVDELSASRTDGRGRGFNLRDSGFVLSTALELLEMPGLTRKNPAA